MTPVESASRPMLPSAFPDGVGLHGFLYGAQSHGPVARCLRFGPGVAPNAARLASSCAFGLGWTGLATRRVSFRGFSSWHPPQPDLGWRTREIGRSGVVRGRAGGANPTRRSRRAISQRRVRSDGAWCDAVAVSARRPFTLARLPISRPPCESRRVSLRAYQAGSSPGRAHRVACCRHGSFCEVSCT